MKLKRIVAGVLAAVMVVSSLQLSTVTVRAEETLHETVSQNTSGTESKEQYGTDNLIEVPENQVPENQVSENQVIENVPQLEMAEGKMEGVYQFGSSPVKVESAQTPSVVSTDGTATASTDTVEEYLYQQMLARNTTINVQSYNITIDSLSSLFSGVLNEHPDLYFVGHSYRYSYSGTTVYSLILTYDDTLDDTAFQTAKNTALAVVDQEMSELEKAIALHEYLVVNCEYDKENLDAGTIPDTSYSAYGVLVNRIAVCNGYALAYKYLLNQVGIECYMVTSDSMNHAWNMVVLDGKYYQVDVTWDDPTWDLIGRACHTYMFCSDTAFSGHSDWEVTSGSDVVDYVATDTSYDNAFWTSCRSPLVMEGDDCYYVSSDDRTIKKTTLSDVTEVGTAIGDIDVWTEWGNSYSYWTKAYSGLFLANNRLYYNDKNSIYSIALDGTDKRTEFTADTTDGYIYGSAFCQGKVLYSLHQTPNLTEKETVLTADITIESGEPAIIPVESIELSENSLTLVEGKTATLTATVNPENATESNVTWTSSNDAVAEVENGVVKAVSAGNCNVTAAAGGNYGRNRLRMFCL